MKLVLKSPAVTLAIFLSSVFLVSGFVALDKSEPVIIISAFLQNAPQPGWANFEAHFPLCSMVAHFVFLSVYRSRAYPYAVCRE